uniref:Uncharacterized protein n=1 Tax=Aquila chrysaetos chrysaetos TaxID=223781 RepID=A0A663ETZ4_AQUCH
MGKIVPNRRLSEAAVSGVSRPGKRWQEAAGSAELFLAAAGVLGSGREEYKALCAVVIDTGTGHTRSGLAGDEQPRSVVPSRVGGSPVLTHGVVTDWDGLEELWHRVLYQELGVCPEEVAVLATDAPLSPIANREKVADRGFTHRGGPAGNVTPGRPRH